MTDPGRLELNARGYQPDPRLDEALRLFREDRDRYDRLPAAIQSAAGVYADLRDHYAKAVRAGVIPADRGPAD